MSGEGPLFGLECKWRTEITKFGSLCETQGALGLAGGSGSTRRRPPGWVPVVRRRNEAALRLYKEAARIEMRAQLLEAALSNLLWRIQERGLGVYLSEELEAARGLLKEGP